MELQQSIAVQDNCLDILFRYSFLGSLLRDTAQNRNWVSQVQGRYELEGEYAKCLYSKHSVTLERKQNTFLPLLRKLNSYNGKSAFYMPAAFPFYSSLTRQAFFFHIAVRLAY